MPVFEWRSIFKGGFGFHPLPCCEASLLHVAGRIVRHARSVRLRLPRSWPWAETLATVFTRLQALSSG